VVHTDGWLGYEPLQARGYIHQVTFLRGQQKSPSELLPRVHRVISLLKRWLLVTPSGELSFPSFGRRVTFPELLRQVFSFWLRQVLSF
jgi:hypothetical protein